MRVLITGGAGFIGGHILKECETKGWHTISLDIAEHNQGDSRIKGSILNFRLLHGLMKDVDFVFHEAAVTAPPQFEELPEIGYMNNVQGTFNVLEAAHRSGVKRVVLASSSALYGDNRGATREEKIDTSFRNVYPLTKYHNELAAKFYANNTNLQTVCLRYFNTYGYGENTKRMYSSPIDKFIQNLINNESPIIFGDGNQSRDFIYVKDVARANILAAEKGITGQTYNIGTGATNTFNYIYSLIRKEMKSDIEATFSPVPFKSYQLFTRADISKAKSELGFFPEYDIRAGIRETVEKFELMDAGK